IKGVAVFVLSFVVGQCAVDDQRGVIVAILCVRHFQGREDIFRREIAQTLSAGSFDDRRQQKKARVAIEPIAAGGKIQRFLAMDKRQRIVVGGNAVGVDSGE